MYVCIYVCTYLCMYVSMYLCVYVSMYLSSYVSMYLCMYVSMYVRIYVSMYLCVYVSKYLCIYVSMYLYIYIYVCMYIYIYGYVYIYIYTVCICIYIYIYTCIYIYIYVYIDMYVYIYIYIGLSNKNMKENQGSWPSKSARFSSWKMLKSGELGSSQFFWGTEQNWAEVLGNQLEVLPELTVPCDALTPLPVLSLVRRTSNFGQFLHDLEPYVVLEVYKLTFRTKVKSTRHFAWSRLRAKNTKGTTSNTSSVQHQISIGKHLYDTLQCQCTPLSFAPAVLQPVNHWSLKFEHLWLVVSTPLKNMTSSVGMIIPNIWKHRKCSKPPSWCIYIYIYIFTHSLIIVMFVDVCSLFIGQDNWYSHYHQWILSSYGFYHI